MQPARSVVGGADLGADAGMDGDMVRIAPEAAGAGFDVALEGLRVDQGLVAVKIAPVNWGSKARPSS